MTQGFNQPPGKPANTGAVSAPAIALIVVGALDVLYALFNLVINIVIPGNNQIPEDLPPELAEFAQRMQDAGPLVSILISVVWLLLAGLLLFGAVNMFKRKSYGLAMTAAIIAMIPCTGIMDCCILAEIGIGIWALVVLMQAHVKPMFN